MDTPNTLKAIMDRLPDRPAVAADSFPDPEYLARYAPYCRMTGEEMREFNAGLAAMPETLRDVLRRVVGALYGEKRPLEEIFHGNPELEKDFGTADGGVFYLAVALAGLRFGEAIWQEKKLPPEMMRDSFGDLRRWLDLYRENYGSLGVPWHIMFWIQGFLRAERVDCGRLQFDLPRCYDFLPGVLFIAGATGERTLLAKAGLTVNEGGICEEGPNTFVTEFVESEDGWEGHAVCRNDGRIAREKTFLPRGKYRREIDGATPLLNIHIPSGGGMTPELCAASCDMIAKFMAEYMPERSWHGFCCFSWLLDPQLRQLLPAESNIIRFQDSGFTISLPGGADTEFRTCGVAGFAGVKTPNSMQRALGAFAAAGGKFHSGCLLRPADCR